MSEKVITLDSWRSERRSNTAPASSPKVTDEGISYDRAMLIFERSQMPWWKRWALAIRDLAKDFTAPSRSRPGA